MSGCQDKNYKGAHGAPISKSGRAGKKAAKRGPTKTTTCNACKATVTFRKSLKVEGQSYRICKAHKS